MVNIKCADCAEYRNEWCEKVIDSPHPDMLRDCQYFREKDRDLIKVIRCKDCKYYRQLDDQDDLCQYTLTSVEADDYCSYAERKEGEAE